jgi:hypothetical protein
MTTDPAPRPPDPCLPCPWRTENHGKPHPDGWYTKTNRNRLWAGLRRGEDMSCHPTDPRNEVSEAAQAAGYRPAPERAEARECVGAWVLKQREVQIFQDLDGDLARYRAERPRGLTRVGILAAVSRIIFGGTFLGGPQVGRPNLNAPVGHDGLPWTPRTPKETR